MKQKLFTLLTLLVLCVTGAWADPVYHDLTNGTPVFLTKTYVDAANWITKGGKVTSTKDLKNKTWYNPSTDALAANGYSSSTNFYVEKTYNSDSSNDYSLYLYVAKGLGQIAFYAWCNSTPDDREMTFTVNGKEASEKIVFSTGATTNAGYVYVNLDQTKDNIIRVNGSNELELYAVKGVRDYKTSTKKNAPVEDISFLAYSGNAGGISDSGADEVTFEGIATLAGANMQSGGSNLTVSSTTYASIKGARNNTYVLTPVEGVTIKSVRMYTTSNDKSKTCIINTPGSGPEEIKARTDANRADPTTIALGKNGDNYEFTVANTSEASQNLFVLVITYDKVENVDVAVSSAGYATLYYDKNLVVPTGVKAYKAAVSGSNIALTDIGALIPANTGVILEAAKGTYNFATTTADASGVDVDDNILEGTTSEIATPSGAYTLGQNGGGVVGLRAYTGAKIRAYSAYSTYGALPKARDFYAFDEDVTAINKVETKKVENGVFYNLAGQQVAQPTKGLYIVNGKKVVLK